MVYYDNTDADTTVLSDPNTLAPREGKIKMQKHREMTWTIAGGCSALRLVQQVDVVLFFPPIWLPSKYSTPLSVIGDALCMFHQIHEQKQIWHLHAAAHSASLFLPASSAAKCLQKVEFIVSLSCIFYDSVHVTFYCKTTPKQLSATHSSLLFFVQL